MDCCKWITQPRPLLLDNVPLVKKGSLKLAESVFSLIEKCNDVTCNKDKQFLISYQMDVSFKLNNFDFPLLSFPTVSKPASSVPATLSFATACSSPSYVSALSRKSFSDPTNICDGAVCSSNVYPRKPIHPSKPVCLSNVKQSNVSPSKPVRPSNICL